MSGWKRARLADVCSLIARGIAPNYVDEGGTLVLNQKCVRGHTIGYELGRRHDAAVKRVPQERFVQLGDVLINSTGTGTLGRVAQVRSQPVEPATVDTHVTIVRPKPGEFHPDFFGYALILLEKELAQSGEGASGQTELARTTIGRFEITYPADLEEQRRIVAVLDETFAAIATATANAEKNLAASRELFDATLRSLLNSTLGPWTTLGEANDIKVGFAFKSSGYSSNDDDIPLIRGDNILQGRLRWDDVKRWPQSAADEYEAYQLEQGDVLLAMDRTWVKAGLKYAVVQSDDVPSLLVQRVARLRAKDITFSDFIALQIAAPAFTDYILSIQTGLGVPHISGKQISDYRFRLPPRTKQIELIETVSGIKSASDELARGYATKLVALERLRKSLLKRAFSGELTEQEPLAA